MSRAEREGFAQRVARIEGLVQSLEAADEGVRASARELVAAVLELHREGLARVMTIAGRDRAAGRTILDACRRDDLVASLLTLHDLEPGSLPEGLVTLRVPREMARDKPPDPSFRVRGARAVEFATTPHLALDLAIEAAPREAPIAGIALQYQVRIEAQRRRYTTVEQTALDDLFGEPGRWERTLRPLLWENGGVMVAPFAGETSVELPLACTFDLSIGAARYFHALEGGEAPLHLLFSGTMFHTREDGALQVAQVPWSKEARFSLPVSVYRDAMDHHYPGSAGVRMRRDLFDRVDRLRRTRGLATWDAALEGLLPPAEEP